MPATCRLKQGVDNELAEVLGPYTAPADAVGFGPDFAGSCATLLRVVSATFETQSKMVTLIKGGPPCSNESLTTTSCQRLTQDIKLAVRLEGEGVHTTGGTWQTAAAS